MWRGIVAAVLVYGYGHPGFDGFRPEILDLPLTAFHQQVNHVASDGKYALTTLDPSSSMRYLKSYIDTVDTQLRGAKPAREDTPS